MRNFCQNSLTWILLCLYRSLSVYIIFIGRRTKLNNIMVKWKQKVVWWLCSALLAVVLLHLDGQSDSNMIFVSLFPVPNLLSPKKRLRTEKHTISTSTTQWRVCYFWSTVLCLGTCVVTRGEGQMILSS